LSKSSPEILTYFVKFFAVQSASKRSLKIPLRLKQYSGGGGNSGGLHVQCRSVAASDDTCFSGSDIHALLFLFFEQYTQ